MKNTFFDQQHVQRCFICRTQLPHDFDFVLELMIQYDLKPFIVNAQLGEVELSTDPHRHTYIECCGYLNIEDYVARKRQYQEYLERNANEIEVFYKGSLKKAELKNGLSAVLFENDKKQILVWETERSHIEHIDPQELLLALQWEKEDACDREEDVLIAGNMGEMDGKKAVPKVQKKLRFDGFYVLRKKQGAEYLRFFPNGKVVGILFDKDSVSFLKDKLDEEYEENGSYTLIDEGIIFNIKFLNGNLLAEYKGIVEKDMLVLFRKIQGSSKPRQLGTYCFHPIEFEEKGEDYE